jgi:hypothetical protein
MSFKLTVDSEIESSLLEWRESRGDWSPERSGQEAEVDLVEVFLFSLGAVEVDISLGVFLVHGQVNLDGSLKKTVRSSVGSMSGVSIDSVRWDRVWHKDGSGQHSWVPPSLSCFGVNLVVDGNVRFPEIGLLESSPETWFSGRGEGSRVLGRSLLFSALLVWPSVAGSLVLLSL